MTASENIDKQSMQQLDKIIRQHTIGSIGLGLLPIPGVDLAGLLVIQSNMIKEIATVYNVPFLKEAAKNALSSLISGALLTSTIPVAASMMKIVPVLGQAVGMATMPVICGASTYAAGKVFIRHFESGGTFLTFDSDKVKAYYSEMLREGKKFSGAIKKQKK